MEIQDNEVHSSLWCGWIRALLERFNANIVEFARETKNLGQEDPRRIIHSLKVGLAITLISLFYYFEPLYDGFGVSAMWAVMTVVSVFELSVGATLSRGVNRAVATFLSATLAFGAHHLAVLSGEESEPVFIGLFVFLIAGMVTFARFFPRMKERYDYGLLIFILTFCLISVSGYRDDEVLDMVYSRISTIVIGGLTAVIVCVGICPVWAGDDLSKLVAANIEKLGVFLEGFGVEVFRLSGEGESRKAASLQGFESIIDTITEEESLANFARWEPGHGPFRIRLPWKQYLKIGSLTRECDCRIESLNGYLSYGIQTPPEIGGKIQELSTKMSTESGKALKELDLAIRTTTAPSSAGIYIIKSKNATENIKSLFNSTLSKDTPPQEIVLATTVISLLVDVVSCTEKIAESVYVLASHARFKSEEHQPERPKSPDEEAPKQGDSIISISHQVITV
ncbi:ALUMINUM ACTIVATED MALATE TRANSPORTER FAMILY PROTEIN [Salix purpurea]|uniref:ALUMINUM ACTIVATED MALATE TRANSPORTER FAMILY PROTEIN n=1 Tax=Salix purpurea TaxID=77065 RepID=A0A9Q0PP44_SALPP|nr:ALUMINUM ACTIVATED MALATE TRANSPORTER FAMILY PROTEIN [Salix purpurea]